MAHNGKSISLPKLQLCHPQKVNPKLFSELQYFDVSGHYVDWKIVVEVEDHQKVYLNEDLILFRENVSLHEEIGEEIVELKHKKNLTFIKTLENIQRNLRSQSEQN